MLGSMALEAFITTIAAVLVGNGLSMVVAYGIWRATRAERRLGVKNGGDLLPTPLLIGMLVPFGIVGWAALLLS